MRVRRIKEQCDLRRSAFGSIVMDLRKCCDGASDAIIASVKCPKNFSLNSVLVTRESLNRLCEYGSDISSRYLDDQVCAGTAQQIQVLNYCFTYRL